MFSNPPKRTTSMRARFRHACVATSLLFGLLASTDTCAGPLFSPLHEWCIRAAVSVYYRPTDPISYAGLIDLVHALMGVESGCGVAHVNVNRSVDYGCMQINSSHLRMLAAYGISQRAIQYNDCQNIMIGTWVIESELKSGNDLWTSIGNYNSRTPVYNRAYQMRVWAQLQRLWSQRLASR